MEILLLCFLILLVIRLKFIIYPTKKSNPIESKTHTISTYGLKKQIIVYLLTTNAKHSISSEKNSFELIYVLSDLNDKDQVLVTFPILIFNNSNQVYSNIEVRFKFAPLGGCTFPNEILNSKSLPPDRLIRREYIESDDEILIIYKIPILNPVEIIEIQEAFVFGSSKLNITDKAITKDFFSLKYTFELNFAYVFKLSYLSKELSEKTVDIQMIFNKADDFDVFRYEYMKNNVKKEFNKIKKNKNKKLQLKFLSKIWIFIKANVISSNIKNQERLLYIKDDNYKTYEINTENTKNKI